MPSLRSLLLLSILMSFGLGACSAQAAIPPGTAVPSPSASSPTPLAPTAEPTVVPSAAPSLVPSATAAATSTMAPTAGTGATPAGMPSPTSLASPVSGAQNCGQVSMLGPNPPRDSTALTSEQCFWQAFQQCQIATLTVTMRGVDAGTTHLFTIQKSNGACRVTDAVQSYVIPLRTPSVQTFACADLVQQNGGLLVKGCGQAGDISVPAPGTP